MTTRRVRRVTTLVVVVGALFLAAEVSARLLSPYLPAPVAWPDETTRIKADQIRALGCADVVIAGNSMARDGVDPNLLGGVAGYNAALDAATPEVLTSWLSDEVVPALDPQVVVLALASMDLNANSAGGQDAATAYASSLEGRDDVLGRLAAWSADQSALVRHRVELRTPDTLWDGITRAVRRDAVDDTVDRENGSVIGPRGEGRSRRELTYTGTSAISELVRTEFLADFEIDPDEVGAARELIRELQHDGRAVVLVALPVTDEFVALHPGGRSDIAAFRQEMASIADETGVPLLDHLDDAYPDERFADTHHLNGDGATMLTGVLRDELPHITPGCAS